MGAAGAAGVAAGGWMPAGVATFAGPESEVTGSRWEHVATKSASNRRSETRARRIDRQLNTSAMRQVVRGFLR
jgi:hypothetical protein